MERPDTATAALSANDVTARRPTAWLSRMSTRAPGTDVPMPIVPSAAIRIRSRGPVRSLGIVLKTSGAMLLVPR